MVTRRRRQQIVGSGTSTRRISTWYGCVGGIEVPSIDQPAPVSAHSHYASRCNDPRGAGQYGGDLSTSPIKGGSPVQSVTSGPPAIHIQVLPGQSSTGELDRGKNYHFDRSRRGKPLSVRATLSLSVIRWPDQSTEVIVPATGMSNNEIPIACANAFQLPSRNELPQRLPD